MRYLGGKAAIAKHVVDVIERYRAPGQPVWEPFCGGLNVTAELARRGVFVFASDASVPLIALLTAVRDGWQPPTTLTREEWYAAKMLDVTHPLHGFAMQGCSFGGRYGEGYAKPDERHTSYAAESAKALLCDVPLVCANGAIGLLDMLAVEPGPTEALLYCDPPYAGRKGYGAVGAFDRERFVERVVEWSRHTTVLVSEYDFPIGEVVWSRERASKLRVGGARHVERIYRVGPPLPGASEAICRH